MDILMTIVFAEQVLIYGAVFLLFGLIILIYVLKLRRQSRLVGQKIEQARESGLYEPVSLHPVINPNKCIQSGACISACPEKDIIGIMNGRATTINASRCIGHGACFHACPTEAITLHIGTATRGVDLPHVNQFFESNVPGIYIAGELGGMGLIKNAVEQGKQAVENLTQQLHKNHGATYDLIIIGAGPAGISACLTAKKLGINALTVDQDTLGGTVFTFPRSKIVMTSAMNLPLYGKVKLFETNKQELLTIWNEALNKNGLAIKEQTKIEKIEKKETCFEVVTAQGETLTSAKVLIAIGRRGTPRKLGIPGENSQNVAYRLLEPEDISNKKICVVGGGDSAVESALLLCDQNEVMLSYRRDGFQRIKPKNQERVEAAIAQGKLKVLFNSNLLAIEDDAITIEVDGDQYQQANDLVYIFAGGELPSKFLENAGITITKKFGEALLKH
ncbi:MAG: NAD(P)-binding domain-containing protein [Bacteroidetes bacterium]|jgi:thioredoxin reductase (NADPH)|nr:NAD(P)-binding domain-containing protein [Bacteroidota bacterium]